MKTLRLFLLVLGLAAGIAPLHAAGHAGLRAILISASPEHARTDDRLGEFEPHLRRILRFESFRFLGEDSAEFNVPGGARLGIGNGHRLEVEIEGADARGIHAHVRWLDGGRNLMNTTLVLRPGVPAILGGPANGRRGEVYAVILIAR